MKASFALLALANTLALAQNFFSSSDVPACAVNCPQLNAAQAGCLPPAPQPATCFCNSAYLVTLASQPSVVCPGCTSQSDLSQLTGWFNQFCKQGGSATYDANGVATSAPTAAATGAATASTAASVAAAASSASSASGNSGSSNVTPINQNLSWWDKHKGWIAMVIVLIFGFAIVIAVGVWWKKRYIRKRDAAGASLPGAWGPSQNQHPADGPARNMEKPAGASAAAIAAGPPRGSKKHRKARKPGRS